ncbi:MAG: sulfatase [Aureliella sp.]
MLTNQRCRWLTYLLLIEMSLLCGPVPVDAVERPNVLWIVADDLSPDLECYGYQGVRTPNVDRLAGSGIRFENAFATAPVCSSARSAFITGVYQTTTGTHQHRTLDKKALPEPFRPVTEIMRDAGYFVCNAKSSLKSAGKTDYNFEYDKSMYDGFSWDVAEGGRKEGQPFFAQVQIHEPHRDFSKASKVDRARFGGAKIPVYYPGHPVVRADWSDYLNTVEIMDRKIGQVLGKLKEDSLLDNTAVFFFGDHGRPHYRDKQWLYDGGIRVPLIVRLPGSQAAGEVRDELISLIDVTAATLGLAGVEVPGWMEGRDFLSETHLARNKVFAARDRCGSTLDRIRCVRTAQYKYIRNFYPELPYSQHSGYKFLQYPAQTAAQAMFESGRLTGPARHFWQNVRPVEELYDLREDPNEINNLADAPEHKSILLELRSELDEWILRTDDQGEFPEVAVQAAVESSERWFRGRMSKRGLPIGISAADYLRWWEIQLGLD